MALAGVHSGGLGFLVGTGWFALQVEASRTWPQVPAQVVSSELGFRVDSDNNRFVDPDVTFRYDIDGKTYTGDRVSFGSGDAAWSQARVNAYPVGQVIDVRINPDDPTDAVIEPGGRGWERFLPLGGLVPLGVGVGIILSDRRRLESRIDAWSQRTHPSWAQRSLDSCHLGNHFHDCWCLHRS